MMTPHIPILRAGHAYDSVESVELVHHATGARVATVGQANSGLIARDVRRMDDRVLEGFPVAELLAKCRAAAELFASATLPLGNGSQTFDEYLRQLSATTGMPIAFCRANASKVQRVLAEMDTVVRGLTRGFDLGILDAGFGRHLGGTLSYFRVGRIFGAVLPSNSPGVHSLWIPAVALKAPVVLKPGREEPWTPFRVIQALMAAGLPPEAFGFYPTDHGGAAELLRSVDRSMLFGDTTTTKPWANDARVQLHGPGFSKVLLGDDTADDWPKYLDVIESSIVANGGRSCINASAVWTPRHGRALALALAERMARVEALPVEDPRATIAAFANPTAAEGISKLIDHGLREPGAVDLTERARGAPRLVRGDHQGAKTHGLAGGSGQSGPSSCAYLLPTVIWCESVEHPLANREFLFPYASVLECPTEKMAAAIGPTLVVSAISSDSDFTKTLMASRLVDRLNLGPIPTWQLSWDQPHEGNLFEHLYRQRAFQMEPAA